MKKRIIYLLIFTFPFLGMITVNEFVRINTVEEGYKKQGVVAINSAKRVPDKCSWTCHNDTEYCIDNHVKLATPYLDKISPIYFGIIYILKATGDYGLANIIFLVVIIPFIMYFLLIKSISIQVEINKRKKR